jgi:hypothetical protein
METRFFFLGSLTNETGLFIFIYNYYHRTKEKYMKVYLVNLDVDVYKKEHKKFINFS